MIRIIVLVEDEEKNLSEKIISFIKEQLETGVQERDIAACFGIGKKGENCRPIILKLISEGNKVIYRAHIKINQMNSRAKEKLIFINEDLTPSRAKLAAKACQEVKSRRIYSTWSMGGEIFVKLQQGLS